MSNFLAIGLGNPGAEYVGTRHNVGAATIDLLTRQIHGSLKLQRREHARVATGSIAGTRVVLAVPTTYMNESGVAASSLVRHYLDRVEPPLTALVVIHDELDLEPGVVRVKLGGGTAGHNGLKSIGAHLHTLEFARIRIGVGKPPHASAGADYVLRRVPTAERAVLDAACERAAQALELIVSEGLDRAMTDVNSR